MTNNTSNTVELMGTYGSDITHALSAWTSTSRDLDEDKMTRMPKLLKYLASNGHHTPFEKSSLHFLSTTDLASHIHILKHRVGTSVNSESPRYKELQDDKAYLPVDWDSEERQRLYKYQLKAFEEYHNCIERLVESGVTRKRAKESARFYLPYSNQLTIDIMFNFRSFYHFLGLRYSKHAQVEIRNIAKDMLQQVIDQGDFVHTLKAFSLTKEDGSIVDPFE